MRLILENISMRFADRVIFENISITIEKGEVLTVSGPNGSGKTTLVRIIASLLRPTMGRASLQVGNIEYSGYQRLFQVGLVAPDLYLYDELTASENLGFFSQMAGIKTTDFSAELEQFGLRGRGGDLVKSYSSGMKQRLKFILALLRKPPLLLLDEPMANLDPAGKQVVEEIIKRHEGITVLATNEESDLKYGNRTIRLGD